MPIALPPPFTFLDLRRRVRDNCCTLSARANHCPEASRGISLGKTREDTLEAGKAHQAADKKSCKALHSQDFAKTIAGTCLQLPLSACQPVSAVRIERFQWHPRTVLEA